MSAVSGTCDGEFTAVRELFEEHFSSGQSCGASVSCFIDGRCVVDLYGGSRDKEMSGAWVEDSIVNVFSACKAWTALCIHILKERGHIDSYEDPISKYWPEFGRNGKEGITIAHALTHSTGLQTLREPVHSLEKLTDWEYMTGLLAAQAPLWEPGSKSVYHAFTYGHINGEIVRRCDPMHRTVGRFFKEEVRDKLDIDAHMGLGHATTLLDDANTDERERRLAKVFSGDEPERYLFPGDENDFDTAIRRLISTYESVFAEGPNATQQERTSAAIALGDATALNPQRFASRCNSIEWQRAELPASGGYTNARAMAKLYSALACTLTTDAARVAPNPVIGRAALAAATQREWVTDGPFGAGSKYAGGFGIRTLGEEITPRAFGHGGLGGHVTFGDPDECLGFGYTMNRCVASGVNGNRFLGYELARAVYRCLGKGKSDSTDTSGLTGTQGAMAHHCAL